MNAEMMQHIDDVVHHCIHCGMCLPVCPTYALTNQEQSSPRGRIRLMRSMHEGSLDLSDNFVDEMYFCLDCQACQTACPAGVQYGELVEDARRIIAEENRDPFSLRLLKFFFLRGILSSPIRTRWAAKLLRFYQQCGVRDAVEQSNILSLISERLHEKHAMLPRISGQRFDETVPEIITPEGKSRGRVAFLSGCIMNVAFADVHRNAVSVLVANDFEVVIPKQQVCCGSLHGHNGDVNTAKALARTNIDVFDKYSCDYLVVDSAGCGAFLKEYGKLFADEDDYAVKAETLARKTKDIMEFLVEVGFKPPQPGKPCEGSKPSQGLLVTYHEACHLVHSQMVSRQPRKLIKSIPGLEFIELPEAAWCCGSAGIYNIVRFDDSMQLLERKMNNLASTKADIVLTGNPGCHLQLQYGIKKFGLKIEVMHPVSLLSRAYREGIGCSVLET